MAYSITTDNKLDVELAKMVNWYSTRLSHRFIVRQICDEIAWNIRRSARKGFKSAYFTIKSITKKRNCTNRYGTRHVIREMMELDKQFESCPLHIVKYNRRRRTWLVYFKPGKWRRELITVNRQEKCHSIAEYFQTAAAHMKREVTRWKMREAWKQRKAARKAAKLQQENKTPDGQAQLTAADKRAINEAHGAIYSPQGKFLCFAKPNSTQK